MKKVIRCAGPVIALGLATASLVAAPASATTFCVPTFRADCPNSGGNKAEADVEKAMSTEAADGKADQILIAPGTYTETNAFEPAGGDGGTFEPTGSDKLTIAGAGPGATVLTSGQTGNAYILNLDFNNTREITLRDLTIRAPATLPDGGGAAVQAHGAAIGAVANAVDRLAADAGRDAAGHAHRGGQLRARAAAAARGPRGAHCRGVVYLQPLQEVQDDARAV